MDPAPELLLPEPLPRRYRPTDYTLVVDLEDTLLHSDWSVSWPDWTWLGFCMPCCKLLGMQRFLNTRPWQRG